MAGLGLGRLFVSVCWPLTVTWHRADAGKSERERTPVRASVSGASRRDAPLVADGKLLSIESGQQTDGQTVCALRLALGSCAHVTPFSERHS